MGKYSGTLKPYARGFLAGDAAREAVRRHRICKQGGWREAYARRPDRLPRLYAGALSLFIFDTRPVFVS
jgi:hypothetical protein